jgi:signal peptidase
MKLIRKINDVVIALLAASVLITAVAFIYFQSSLLVVTSASMEPSFKPGDILLVRPVKTSQIERLDVVVLPVPDVAGLRFSHRVNSISRELTGFRIRTQGDANPNPDTWSLNVIDQQVPKVIAVLPTSFIFALTHIFGNDT